MSARIRFEDSLLESEKQLGQYRDLKLKISSNGLSDYIPDLWSISGLSILDVSGNIWSTLSIEIGLMSHLISLYVSDLSLSGTIPSSLRSLTALESLRWQSLET